MPTRASAQIATACATAAVVAGRRTAAARPRIAPARLLEVARLGRPHRVRPERRRQPLEHLRVGAAGFSGSRSCRASGARPRRSRRRLA